MTAWKRHWKIPAGLMVMVLALFLLAGSNRIIAYVGAGGDTSGYTGGLDYGNDIDLFDGSMVHTVELKIDQTDLEAMVRLYQEDGTKEWFSADITIDGVTIPDVGVRLKGFSTLRTAVGEVGGRQTQAAEGEVNYDDLPFLVRLDAFNEGVFYQGVSEIALRTEGPTEDETLLEEMVSISVIGDLGLDVPQVVYTSISINGGPATLRILAENPTDEFADRIDGDGDGVLYKAQSSGTFQYLGHDPVAYEGVFEQESAINELDLNPLMDFVEFVELSSDEDFASDLDEWLDVDSFIDYLAIHNLLVNVDSLAGTNHNFYLYYDAGDDLMTVLSWDMNEALGGFWRSDAPSWTLLPDWSNAQSTFGRPLIDQVGEGAEQPEPQDGGIPRLQQSELPGDRPIGQYDQRPPRPKGQFPQRPEGGFPPPADGELPQQPPGGVGAGGVGGRNVLLNRFLAVDEFAAAYEARYAELQAIVFDGGLLVDALADAAELLQDAAALGLLTDQEVSQGVRERMQWIGQRASFLEGLE